MVAGGGGAAEAGPGRAGWEGRQDGDPHGEDGVGGLGLKPGGEDALTAAA